MGIFPSPLPAWGVGHVDAQEQFSEVSPVLEPERGGEPQTEPKSLPQTVRLCPSEESPFWPGKANLLVLG